MAGKDETQQWSIWMPIIVALISAAVPTMLWLGGLGADRTALKEDVKTLESKVSALESNNSPREILPVAFDPRSVQWGVVNVETNSQGEGREFEVEFEHAFESVPVIVVSGEYQPIDGIPTDEPVAAIRSRSRTGFTVRLVSNVEGRFFSSNGKVHWIAIASENGGGVGE